MKNLWWAYLHTEGTIQVKRFFDDEDLKEAAESPFVQRYLRPFEADSRDEALKIAEALFGLEQASEQEQIEIS